MPRSKPDGEPTNPLAKQAQVERKYSLDAGIEPTQQDVAHLCKVWADVGRAILARRQEADEQEILK